MKDFQAEGKEQGHYTRQRKKKLVGYCKFTFLGGWQWVYLADHLTTDNQVTPD